MNRFVWLSTLITLPTTLFAGTLQSVALDVKNMTCAVCPITVKKALEKVPGSRARLWISIRKLPASPLIRIRPAPPCWQKRPRMQAIRPLFTTKIVYERACLGILAGVPCLRLRQARNDAERRLSVLLRMCWLQDPAASKAGGLLRFLFLRFGKVSPDARRE
jgi:hypothetical protein